MFKKIAKKIAGGALFGLIMTLIIVSVVGTPYSAQGSLIRQMYIMDVGGDLATVTTNGELNVLDSDYFFQVCQGEITGAFCEQVFINDDDVDQARETMWEGTGNLVFQTSDQAVEILSADVDDTILGAGARTVYIGGVNDAFELIFEIKEMDGQTPVVLSDEFLFINKVQVLTAGASGFNEGLLTVRVSVAGATMAVVLAENSISHGPGYAVAADYTASLSDYQVFTGRNIDATLYFTVLTEARVKTTLIPFHVYQSAMGTGVRMPFSIPEKSIIFFDVESSVANQHASLSLNLALVPN